MPVGMCRHCAYAPVAQDAPLCPKRGGRNPHPDAVMSYSTIALFGLLGVAIAVAAMAGVVYYLQHK
jgi:hypothetical protein